MGKGCGTVEQFSVRRPHMKPGQGRFAGQAGGQGFRAGLADIRPLDVGAAR